ncbi:CIA30 family protein [Robiginitalea sp.]|uniref:CIA30 family protein n=1 Tax=Robiginitalea sp. TaxID=1902411 RepID=UPI003C74C77E
MKKHMLLLFCTLVSMTLHSIFDFQSGASLKDWYVVNDGVMGGRSAGNLRIDAEGHGLFSGKISLENNGGFSSIRYDCGPKDLSGYRFITLKVKGDGQRYQLRVKASLKEYYSYVSYFETTGDWQVLKLPLNSMYPVFRGRRMDMPDFSGNVLEEIGILIGNKEATSFELRIDAIGLE